MFRRILQRWVESWGFGVVLAEDGNQAWEILRQEQPPQLLILDWVMPGIDGLELCRRTRAARCGPYQYILLVTARDRTPDVVRGLEAGADDYLTKPFDKAELHARLRVGRRILSLAAESDQRAGEAAVSGDARWLDRLVEPRRAARSAAQRD